MDIEKIYTVFRTGVVFLKVHLVCIEEDVTVKKKGCFLPLLNFIVAIFMIAIFIFFPFFVQLVHI